MKIEKMSLNNPYKLQGEYSSTMGLNKEYRPLITVYDFGDKEGSWFSLMRRQSE